MGVTTRKRSGSDVRNDDRGGSQAKLKELIHQMTPGDEIILTENQQRVAKLVSELPKAKPGLRPPPGLGKGMISILSEDDEHLKDFAEYMP